MISNNLNIAKSNNSFPTYAIPYPKYGIKFTLVASVEVTVIVPNGVNIAVLSYNPGSLVQSTTGTTAIAALTTTPTSSNERINAPSAIVVPGDTLRFLSSQSDSVFISYYMA